MPGRGEVEAGLGEEGEGRPVGLAGPKAMWAGNASRAESEKWIGRRIFRLNIGFLNLPMLWKFAQGDLIGIWTQGFFLNSSRLLKYFRKMKYVMPCYATLGKIN
jgi:hypothetical protein